MQGQGVAGAGMGAQGAGEDAHARVGASGAGAGVPGTPPPANHDIDLTHAPVASSSADHPTKPTARSVLVANWLGPNPKTTKELAEEYGFSPGAMRSLATKLRRQGAMPRSSRQETKAVDPPLAEKVAERQDKALTTALREAGINDLEELDGPARRRILSELAKHGPVMVRVSAVSKLEDISRQTGQQVGPPDEMTVEGKAERLRVVLTGAGPEVGMLAIGRSLEDWKVQAAAKAAAGKREVGLLEVEGD